MTEERKLTPAAEAALGRANVANLEDFTKPKDEPLASTDEILEGLAHQLWRIQMDGLTSPTEYKLANIVACLVAVIIHERKGG